MRGALSFTRCMVTQEQVQDALRHLHGDKFRRTEIAQRLAQVMPRQNPRDAFIAAISASFEGGDLNDAPELRDLIVACDVEAALSRTLAADRCNTSLRSFYRKRRMALRVIAEHLDRMFDRDPSIELLLQEFAASEYLPERESGIDATFSDFRAQFEAQRSCGDGMAMQTVVAKLGAYRDMLSPAEALEMRLMQAEISIKLGELHRAADVVRSCCLAPVLRPHRRLVCLALLQHAQLAFAFGNIEESVRISLALARALAPWEPHWTQAQALLGRGSALAGLKWACASDDLQLQAIQARHAFLAGSFAEAHHDSLLTFAEARSRGLLPAAAYAAATISVCYGAMDPASRDSWALTALRLFASCGSTPDIAKDLFQFGPVHRSTVWLTHADETELLEIYCCTRDADHSSTLRDVEPFIGSLVRTIVTKTAGRKSADASLDDLVELAWDAVRGRSGLTHIAKELESLAQFGAFLKVLWPAAEQARYAARFNSTAGIVVRAVTRELSHRQIRALSHVS